MLNKIIDIVTELYFNRDHYQFDTPDDLKKWLQNQLA